MASKQQPAEQSSEVNPLCLVDYSSEEEEGNADSSSRADVVKPAKSALFTRIFGEDDEVAVLEGMDDFRKEMGGDPHVERDAFFDFMKKKLKVDVAKAQLMDKVRRLKKRYMNRANKGEGRAISSKPHKRKLYELSKKVWAGDAAMKTGERKVSAVAKIGKKKQKVGMGLVENAGFREGDSELIEKVTSDPEGFWNAYPYFKDALEVENSEFFPKRMVEYSKIGAAKAREMEVKWRELRAKESEIKSSKLELVKKQTDLFRDVVKP